jgi:hypothetical protein
MLLFLQKERDAKYNATKLAALRMALLGEDMANDRIYNNKVDYKKEKSTKKQQYAILARRTVNGTLENNKRVMQCYSR